MRYAIMVEAQMGHPYAVQLDVALRAEAAGFEAFRRSDHYLSLPGPHDELTTDAWAVVAGLARETKSIRLGIMVTPVTFRPAGVLAKASATLAHMTEGRFDLGLGAGWYEREHDRFGLPFPPIADRASLLEAAADTVLRTWRSDLLTAAAPSRPRLIVGSGGTPRGARIAASFADEVNVVTGDPAVAKQRFQVVAGACSAIGRSPAGMTRSVMLPTLVARTASGLRRRDQAIMARYQPARRTPMWLDWIEDRSNRWLYGIGPDIVRRVEDFAAAGCDLLVLQHLVPTNLDMIDELGEMLKLNRRDRSGGSVEGS